jgi:hypothetical protein
MDTPLQAEETADWLRSSYTCLSLERVARKLAGVPFVINTLCRLVRVGLSGADERRMHILVFELTVF